MNTVILKIQLSVYFSSRRSKEMHEGFSFMFESQRANPIANMEEGPVGFEFLLVP